MHPHFTKITQVYVTFEQKYNISTKWINEFRKGYWKNCPERDNFQMRKITNFFHLFFLLKEYFLNGYKSMFRVLSCLITSIYTYIIMWFYQQRVYTFTERKNRRIIDILHIDLKKKVNLLKTYLIEFQSHLSKQCYKEGDP